jgi:hypothetical protein
VNDALPVAAWLLLAAPSLLIGAGFAFVYVMFLSGVHEDAKRRVARFLRRRRALDRIEAWYPPERLVPLGLAAARARMASERRALERAGILSPRRPPARPSPRAS